jgi:hypothetical protein
MWQRGTPPPDHILLVPGDKGMEVGIRGGDDTVVSCDSYKGLLGSSCRSVKCKMLS